MTSENLATVIGPNLLRGDGDSLPARDAAAAPTTLSPAAAAKEMENIRAANWLLRLLIDNEPEIWKVRHCHCHCSVV